LADLDSFGVVLGVIEDAESISESGHICPLCGLMVTETIREHKMKIIIHTVEGFLSNK